MFAISGVVVLAGLGSVSAASAAPLAKQKCTIVGTNGDDFLQGTSGDDVVCGLGGDDVLLGLDGDDVIRGGRGDDLIVGGHGDDRLSGGAGKDELQAGVSQHQIVIQYDVTNNSQSHDIVAEPGGCASGSLNAARGGGQGYFRVLDGECVGRVLLTGVNGNTFSADVPGSCSWAPGKPCNIDRRAGDRRVEGDREIFIYKLTIS